MADWVLCRTGFVLAVSGVLFFHVYLIIIGQTTYENQKNTARVFGKGALGNCYEHWWAPIPPPFVRFDQAVEDALRQEPPEIIKMCNPPWCDRIHSTAPVSVSNV